MATAFVDLFNSGLYIITVDIYLSIFKERPDDKINYHV